MLFDLCYLLVLCLIILFTFFSVLMPHPAILASLDLQSMQILSHISTEGPPPQITIVFCVAGLIYLKIIWRLINPPRRF